MEYNKVTNCRTFFLLELQTILTVLIISPYRSVKCSTNATKLIGDSIKSFVVFLEFPTLTKKAILKVTRLSEGNFKGFISLSLSLDSSLSLSLSLGQSILSSSVLLCVKVGRCISQTGVLQQVCFINLSISKLSKAMGLCSTNYFNQIVSHVLFFSNFVTHQRKWFEKTSEKMKQFTQFLYVHHELKI